MMVENSPAGAINGGYVFLKQMLKKNEIRQAPNETPIADRSAQKQPTYKHRQNQHRLAALVTVGREHFADLQGSWRYTPVFIPWGRPIRGAGIAIWVPVAGQIVDGLPHSRSRLAWQYRLKPEQPIKSQ